MSVGMSAFGPKRTFLASVCPFLSSHTRCYDALNRGAAMRRREFITILGAAATWPLAAHAQQSDRVRRIGVLMAATADDPEYHARIAAFQQRLQQLGWSDGRNVHIDTRWATTKLDDIR